MSEPAYAWKTNFRSSIAPQVAGNEISRIRAKYGGFFTPAQFVAEETRADAPLHVMLEWDDTKCGVKYREVQARSIIDHIVVVEQEKPRDEWVRAFVSVRTEEGPRFSSSAYVFSVPDLRDDILAQARRDMDIFERKYGQYLALSDTIAAFDAALDRAKKRTYRKKAA